MKSPIFELCRPRLRPLPIDRAEELERAVEERRAEERPIDRDNRRIAWERSLRKAA